MIFLFEQFGYKNTGYLETAANELCSILPHEPIVRSIKSLNKEDKICFRICYDEVSKKHHFETSYFVGVDWIIENQRSIYVQPKQNNEDLEIDYIKLLLEALQEPENFNHLVGLCEIDFNKPYISVTQKQDLLSPLLIVQFLQLLRQIARKGLKKSYYTVSENLNAKVKGKVLIGRDIKENKFKGNLIRTTCRFQEFGINCEENKILKKAYQFSYRAIQQLEKGINFNSLQHILDYIHPAFETVSEDVDISKIKSFNPNPLYKEYDQALKLAQLILKRYSYNITLTEQEKILTPPFWIDMSKLFELYVFKKLREVFSGRNEVTYHFTSNSKELDFLINSPYNGFQMVVDAKYKPRYDGSSISLDDIRQISAYARMKSVYRKLNIMETQVIDCLIVYPQTYPDNFEKDNLRCENVSEYVNFYKIGIRLPQLSDLSRETDCIIN